MTRFRSSAMKVVAALATMLATIPTIDPAGAAYASAVPFSDPYANGTITLCGRNQQPVTSGSLLTVPFVWKAISSTAAPIGYSRAYLTLYQPIQYVDPGNWTGYQLTEDSIFSNASHPVAQATNADVPLLYADHSLPPHWNGLYELRMFFTAPDKSPDTSPYPVAVISVSGDNWSLVSGGGTSCTAGTAVSAETLILPKSELATPRTIVIGTTASHTAATAGSGHGSGSKAAAHSSHATAKSTTTTSAPPTSTGSEGNRAVAVGPVGHSSDGGVPAWLIAVLALIGAAAAAALGRLLLLRRRRHATG